MAVAAEFLLSEFRWSIISEAQSPHDFPHGCPSGFVQCGELCLPVMKSIDCGWERHLWRNFDGRMSLQDKRDRLEYIFHNVTKNKEDLCKVSGMAGRTFRRNYNLLLKGKRLTRKVGSGKSKKISPKNQRRIVQLARRNPKWSGRKIANRIKSATGTQLCQRTIQRHLKAAGYVKKLPRKIPHITPRHEQLRMTFCEEWRHSTFDNVIITDECRFQLHRNTVKVWTRKNARPQKKFPKFYPSVMVWGALLFHFRAREC